MFGKNSVVHTILIILALLFILYETYKILFVNVEGLRKKKLTKICSDIRNCGSLGYDFTDNKVRTKFTNDIKTFLKMCKTKCNSDSKSLGFTNKNKCKQKLCNTKKILSYLLAPV